MSLSVVNLVLLGVSVVGTQIAPMTGKEQMVWRRLQPSFVITLQAGQPVGTAAMIDQDGLFIAHRGSVPTRSIDARTFDGKLLRLQMRSSDGTTQFVLLKVVGQIPVGLRPLVSPVPGDPPGKSLMAVTPSGPFRAFLVSDGKPGVVGPSRRVLPMSEVRFESPAQAFGGALLVSFDGEFMGVLGASLERRDGLQANIIQQNLIRNGGFGGGVGGARGGNFGGLDRLAAMQGPGELTVAYTVSPSVIRRVVDGFRSSSHEVAYPALGVFCKDTPDGGALVQRVTEGGSAEAAGIQAGDVILDIGGNNIRNQIDFGLVMNRQKIGSTITVRIRRGGTQKLVEVAVGKLVD